MKLNKLILSILFFLLGLSVKSQDTLQIKGKVLSIDTSVYYVIIKVKVQDTCSQLVVLSPKINISTKKNAKSGCSEIKIGNSYLFSLKGLSIIKAENGRNLILDLRKFNYYNIFSLNAGEVPYQALNMENKIICFK